MKSVEEIYNEMMAAYAQATGTEAAASGDLAVRMYAMAAQVFALYVQCEWVERQCFPQTAEGTCLDMHAQLRGLERRAATAAEGVLRFTVDTAADQDREIPSGTVCMTAGLVRFETVEDGVLQAGATQADVRARALEPGSAGNVAAGTILTMAVAPVGVSRCTNPEAFSGGLDAEGDESLRERVLETFRRMPNGANAAFYEQGALSFDQVAAASVLPRSRGRGTVDVVAATLEGMPDEELLGQLTDYFQQRREIAVDVLVRAPEAVTVDVAVKIDGGADQAGAAERVKTALRQWFTGERLGQDVLRARLGSLIFGCEGVKNYELTAPPEDLSLEPDQLPVLGTLTVEAMQ